MSDPINHPDHYTNHPSGVECITVTEHMNFCVGNAVKYLWRAGLKGNELEDLKKARWYIEREIERREKSQTASAKQHHQRDKNTKDRKQRPANLPARERAVGGCRSRENERVAS